MSPAAVFFSLLAVGLAQPQHSGAFNDRGFQPGGRIVGGKITSIQKFPYMVSVRLAVGEVAELHRCGGSIISENYVLTAGQCCQSQNTSSLVIRVGSTNVDYGDRYELSEIILHNNYTSIDAASYNDICLLKVSKPLVYSGSVKAVELPKENATVPVGTEATVCGWGGSNYGGDDIKDSLHEVDVPIVAHDVCVLQHGLNAQGEVLVNNLMICAGYEQGGKDFCQSDVGGPLTVSGVQVGIASLTIDCGAAKSASMYTNVAYFRDWIKAAAGV